MKKIITIFLSLIILLFGLVSCSNDDSCDARIKKYLGDRTDEYSPDMLSIKKMIYECTDLPTKEYDAVLEDCIYPILSSSTEINPYIGAIKEEDSINTTRYDYITDELKINNIIIDDLKLKNIMKSDFNNIYTLTRLSQFKESIINYYSLELANLFEYALSKNGYVIEDIKLDSDIKDKLDFRYLKKHIPTNDKNDSFYLDNPYFTINGDATINAVIKVSCNGDVIELNVKRKINRFVAIFKYVTNNSSYNTGSRLNAIYEDFDITVENSLVDLSNLNTNKKYYTEYKYNSFMDDIIEYNDNKIFYNPLRSISIMKPDAFYSKYDQEYYCYWYKLNMRGLITKDISNNNYYIKDYFSNMNYLYKKHILENIELSINLESITNKQYDTIYNDEGKILDNYIVNIPEEIALIKVKEVTCYSDSINDFINRNINFNIPSTVDFIYNDNYDKKIIELSNVNFIDSTINYDSNIILDEYDNKYVYSNDKLYLISLSDKYTYNEVKQDSSKDGYLYSGIKLPKNVYYNGNNISYDSSFFKQCIKYLIAIHDRDENIISINYDGTLDEFKNMFDVSTFFRDEIERIEIICIDGMANLEYDYDSHSTYYK